MSTNVLSSKDIKREWHLLNADGKVLGRLAGDIATILMGKKKVNFVPYLDNGDFVVVTNASKVKVTGKKETEKKYYRHSGYPGGLKTETFDKLIIRRPEEVIVHAVRGMLPKNSLGRKMITKLHVYSDAHHPYTNQVGKKEEKAA